MTRSRNVVHTVVSVLCIAIAYHGMYDYHIPNASARSTVKRSNVRYAIKRTRNQVWKRTWHHTPAKLNLAVIFATKVLRLNGIWNNINGSTRVAHRNRLNVQFARRHLSGRQNTLRIWTRTNRLSRTHVTIVAANLRENTIGCDIRASTRNQKVFVATIAVRCSIALTIWPSIVVRTQASGHSSASSAGKLQRPKQITTNTLRFIMHVIHLLLRDKFWSKFMCWFSNSRQYYFTLIYMLHVRCENKFGCKLQWTSEILANKSKFLNAKISGNWGNWNQSIALEQIKYNFVSLV